MRCGVLWCGVSWLHGVCLSGCERTRLFVCVSLLVSVRLFVCARCACVCVSVSALAQKERKKLGL